MFFRHCVYGTNYEKAVELPEQGSRRPRGVLQLPGRALETFADHEPDRELARDRALPHDPIEGLPTEHIALALFFNLAESAQKSWRRLRGHNQLPKVIEGVTFADGIEVVRPLVQTAAA